MASRLHSMGESVHLIQKVQAECKHSSNQWSFTFITSHNLFWINFDWYDDYSLYFPIVSLYDAKQFNAVYEASASRFLAKTGAFDNQYLIQYNTNLYFEYKILLLACE